MTITKDNITEVYNAYLAEYKANNGEEKGLKLFKLTKKVSAGTFAFLTMYNNPSITFHDEPMTRAYEKFAGIEVGSKKTIQMRHFRSQDGYNITNHGGGQYQFVSVEPFEGYRPERRDMGELDDETWEKLKKDFDYRCACCGSKENEKGFKRKSGITKLEKGHCDPREPLSYSNCIPQCDYCNGIALDKFVFDQDGNVKKQIKVL